MSPGAPVSIGLVGCGKLAEVGYVPALAASDVRLVAVADPDPARRDLVATTAAAAAGGRDDEPVAAFPNAAALLDEAAAEIDGLVLASPAATHVTDARLAAEAGVPILVEKPPAADAAGTAELVALGSPVWVAFNRRFDPGAQAVRELVPTQGPVKLSLEISYRRQSWGAHTVHDDALLDLGPHLVDWALWLGGGDPVEVACASAQADQATLDLTTTRGRAHLRAAASRPHRELVELRDGSGKLLAHHRVGGFLAAVLGRLRPASRPHPLAASLSAQLDAFAVALQGEDSGSLATAAEGHAVMTVLDAARASAAGGGRPVPVAVPASAETQRPARDV